MKYRRGSWQITWRGGLLLLTFLLLAAAIFGFFEDWRRYREDLSWVEHTYFVLERSQSMLSLLKDAETGELGYVLTGEDSYLPPYRNALARLPAVQRQLTQITEDNAYQHERLLKLNALTQRQLDEMAATVSLRRTGGPEAALQMVRTRVAQQEMEGVHNLVDRLQQEERRLLNARTELTESQANRTRLLALAAGLGLSVMLLLSAFTIERDAATRIRAESDLRASEEQFRRVFEECPTGILLVDSTLRMVRANPSFCRMLEYSEAELQALTIREITHPDNPPEAAPDIQDMHQSGVSRFRMEKQYITKSGKAVWVYVNATVLRNGSGAPLYNLALVEDITLRKQSEAEIQALHDALEQRVAERTAELADANRQLESANRELEAFSYSVSHDLRAPLRGVDSFSQIVLDDYADKLDEVGVGYLRRIRANAQRMGQLIADLLNLSRLSRADLKREAVPLGAMAQAIVKDLHSRAPERDLETAVSGDIHAECDSRLVRVVLENLLGNAWKFTGRTHHARIEFGMREVGGECVYHVSDNGAGFDMAYSNLLFNPFQRLHRANEFEGTGIGLATVQRVIHKHGGRIWAESAVGCGATFFFTLGDAKRPASESNQTCRISTSC